MPLDATGFHRGIDGPGNKGLLIISDRVGGHREHAPLSCNFSFWAALAAEVLAVRKSIPVQTVYTTVASEITTGHLDTYRGSIMLLGIRSDLLAKEVDGPIPPPATDETKKVIASRTFGGALPGYYYFPDTLERMVQDQRQCHLAMALKPDHLIADEPILPLSHSVEYAVSLSDSPREYTLKLT